MYILHWVKGAMLNLFLKVLYETTSEESSEEDNEQGKKNGLLDLEELGPLMKSMKKVKVTLTCIIRTKE